MLRLMLVLVLVLVLLVLVLLVLRLMLSWHRRLCQVQRLRRGARLGHGVGGLAGCRSWPEEGAQLLLP